MVVMGGSTDAEPTTVNNEIAVLGNALHERRNAVELGRERDVVAGSKNPELVPVIEKRRAAE